MAYCRQHLLQIQNAVEWIKQPDMPSKPSRRLQAKMLNVERIPTVQVS